MSHSPTDSTKPKLDPKYHRGWEEMTELIETGGSWSGRERHCCFLNTGTNRFADISAVSGLDLIDDGRAVAVADWDGDGDLDLWISNRTGPRVRFLRNDSAAGHHFLAFRLVGRTCNRDAIGARLELFLKGPQPSNRIKTVTAGDGFLSQSSKTIHFGLGSADEIDRLVVHWPGGSKEQFRGLKADGRYEITQGSGRAVRQSTTMKTALVPSVLKDTSTSGFVRLPLMRPLPVPAMHYADFKGVKRPLIPSGRSAVLINLWASWCAPCAAELKEFTDQWKQCESRGLKIVALSVDGLSDGGESTPADAKKFITRLNVPFATGKANRKLLDKLDVLLDTVVSTRTRIDDASSLPVPASFLLDSSGRLAVIYQGRVSLKTILADLNTIETRTDPLASLAVPFPGRWFLRPGDSGNVLVRFADRFLRRGYPEAAKQYVSLAEELAARAGSPFGVERKIAGVHVDLGNLSLRKGDTAKAESHYRHALKVMPESPQAHTNLGNIDQRRSRLKDASRHYRLALKTDPELAQARINLAAVALEQGHFKEAETELRTLLKTRPEHPPAHNFLGLVLGRQGRLTEALKHFTEAVRLDPKYRDARNNLDKTRLSLENGLR